MPSASAGCQSIWRREPHITSFSHYSTILFPAPFPLPSPQGRWDRHCGNLAGTLMMPRPDWPRFKDCARQLSGHGGNFDNSGRFRKEFQECTEARKPSFPAPDIHTLLSKLYMPSSSPQLRPPERRRSESNSTRSGGTAKSGPEVKNSRGVRASSGSR